MRNLVFERRKTNALGFTVRECRLAFMCVVSVIIFAGNSVEESDVNSETEDS